jgi:DNA-binding CsgD family transcriptional regulator
MKKFGPTPKRLDPSKVESIAAMGGTNEQIAAILGISPTSLKNIRRRQKTVDKAIRRGKDKADFRVVAALYHKATGYSFTDLKEKKIDVPGDTTAMIFWLKNRRPGEWKDRHEVKGAVSLMARLSLTEMKKSLKGVEDAP